MTLQGGWWTWITINATRYHRSQPTFDWADPGFGAAFAVYIFLTIGFQINYLFLYFIIHNLAADSEHAESSESSENSENSEPVIIRYSALLRGTESAWQAVSYGLTSLPLFSEVGGVYFNFALWAVSLFPAWLVIRHFGATEHSTSPAKDTKKALTVSPSSNELQEPVLKE